MTAPNIHKDKAAIDAATAELRRITAELPHVTAPVADAVAAAAAKPLPAGTAESPALKLMQDMAKQLESVAAAAAKDLTAAGTALGAWDGGTDDIDDGAAGSVAAQGSGGS